MLPTTRVDTPFGEFECFENDVITEQLKIFGAHQRSDLATVLSFVRPGDHVIDVGAHIGTFAIPLARKVGPTGSVYAFEAVPDHFELLQRNIRTNELSDVVTPVNAIVSRSVTVRHLSYDAGNTGMAMLTQQGGTELVGVAQMALDDWWAAQDPAPERITVIKIDVEGMEHDVLESARHMVASQRPVLVFEIGRSPGRNDRHSLSKLQGFFSGLDYEFFVNLKPRNLTTDSFALGRLPSLSPLLIPIFSHLDIVAVPKESDRYPVSVANRRSTEAVLYRRVVPQVKQRVKRRVQRGGPVSPPGSGSTPSDQGAPGPQGPA